ncbi:Ig-like domain-containing protein, partial [Curtobacterium flaccumfaciens]
MASTSFRSAAVVCGVLTASLGFGLLTPAVATAAPTSTAPSTSEPAVRADIPDFDALPVDPSLTAPKFYQDWSTPFGSRVLAGDAGGDDLWLVLGDTVYDRATGGGAFFITVQNRLEDAGLEVIRVHTAADGTQTRGERIPIPRTIKIDGLQEQNTFTPGTTHFAGSATAGATVVAKDTASGATLFTTEVSGARNGTGTWNADADLTDSDHVITLTQTTTDGRTNELRDVRFSPAASDAPQAPTVVQKGRVLDGSFVVAGSVAEDVDSVVVQDEAGSTIADASLGETGYSARLPQDRVGSTVYVVGRTADGTSSARVPVALEQLPIDPTAAAPSLRSVFVYPDGRVQVVGEHDDAPGLWILDGDRVVGHATSADAVWSYTIAAAATGKQLDMVNLVFDGRDFSGTSERVALPRLLQVDGIADDNTYAPGARTFSGKAEAGATVTATDQDGHQVFSAEVTGSRSGVGTWKADADLTSAKGYELTFTQTTADGRTSVMRDIAFDAEDDSVAPVVVETPEKNGTATGPRPTFTGTGQAGATIEIRGTTRV